MKTVSLSLEDGRSGSDEPAGEEERHQRGDGACEMVELFDALLETDARCEVLVLTGAGESFAGMDLKDYFRATDDKSAP